ncbi:MAG: HPF/RaiA family ribosome-associated protein [Microcoleaceae cyanobacterium]
MKITPEITYRNVEKTEPIQALIEEKLSKLEQFCDHINTCKVAIEKVHENPSSGSPYRVRIDMTVAPRHELAVDRNPDKGTQYIPLDAVIRDAFDAAQRQLTELNERQNDNVKVHPQQAMTAVVSQLFSEEGYGFIKDISTGREIYFHKNSVAEDGFDRIKVGTGVHFVETLGEMGPQASTVSIVNQI